MKNLSLKQTRNPDLFCLVDENGNWKYYYCKSLNQYFASLSLFRELGLAKGPQFGEWLKSHSAEEIDRILESTGERGSAVHDFIAQTLHTKGGVNRHTLILAEDGINQRELTLEEWRIVLDWATFWKDHRPELIDFEWTDINKKEGYVFTLDFVGILTKKCENKYCSCEKVIGKKIILDWKTSSAIYYEHALQVAGEAVIYKDVKATGVVRIGTRHKAGYELQCWRKRETNHNYKLLQAGILIAKNAWSKSPNQKHYVPFDPDKMLREIPEKLEGLTITLAHTKGETINARRQQNALDLPNCQQG